MANCTKYCNGCDYRGSIGGGVGQRTCDYLLITGRRRDCPAGSECTKKSVGGVVVKGIAAGIREDVHAAEKKREQKPGSRTYADKEDKRGSWA